MNEHETIIRIGDQDLLEGYFIFGTSKATAWNKLLKRVPEDRLISVKKSTQGTKTTWFEAKVPKQYLSRINFGIKSASRELSPEQRAEIAKRFRR